MSLRTKWKMLVALSCFCMGGYFLVGCEGTNAFFAHKALVVWSSVFQMIPILCMHRRIIKAMEEIDRKLGRYTYMDFLGPESAWKDE
jgi:hypothetical protein